MATATGTDERSGVRGDTRVLARERETLERLLPGLDAELAKLPLDQLEEPGGPALRLFREAGGPGLVIPTASEGLGATPLEAVDVQRAVGSRAPSLAIATTMHHFSVATLVEVARRDQGLESLLLQAVARQRSLFASGFAEGQTGQSILAPTMRARRDGEKWRVSGTKKPCSLSASMDLLTVSVALEGEREGATAVALVPATAPGIERRPFWGTPILRGAESDELVLDDVEVPDGLMYDIEPQSDGRVDRTTSDGLLWFELLIAASYLGMASALLERAIAGGKGGVDARLEAAADLETAKAALDAVARRMEDGERSDDLLARALLVRYGVQLAIGRAVPLLAECLGGLAFIGSSDTAYLYAAARALAFHPPSRMRMADRLTTHLQGGDLTIA
jgi:alkylation response protein AidB-like acyl-CoA dehydrogenase